MARSFKTAAAFVVDLPQSGVLGQFALVAENEASVVDVGADLNAGIARFEEFELEFHDEVRVLFVGAAERVVRRVGRAGPDDAAVLDVVLGASAADGPAGEVLAVKNGNEAVFLSENGPAESGREQNGGACKFFEHE